MDKKALILCLVVCLSLLQPVLAANITENASATNTTGPDGQEDRGLVTGVLSGIADAVYSMIQGNLWGIAIGLILLVGILFLLWKVTKLVFKIALVAVVIALIVWFLQQIFL